VHQGTPTPNCSPSGISRGHSAIIHRTVRCTPDMSGAPRKGGLRNSPASGFHSSRSAIIHRTVRCICGATATSGSNGRTNGYLVTWLSHRTCPVCTGLSGAPYDRQLHQRSSLVVGAINTPTTLPFIASKFSSFQPLYKS
jgi:hypothetical protein